MRRRLFLMAAALLACIGGRAQYDVHFTHYSELEYFYNPAAMNRDRDLHVVGSFSMQMAGYEGAPVSMFIGGNLALPYDHSRHAAGGSLLNETIGLFTSKRMAFSYSYKIGIGKGWLNMAVLGGVMSQEFNGSKATMVDSGDPAVPKGSVKGTTGDVGAGLLYVRGDFYAGASALHLNSPHFEMGKADAAQTYIDISPSYYVTGGYNIATKNPLLKVQPYFMLSSDLNFFRADISVKGTYRYEDIEFQAGLTLSPGISVTPMIGGRYGNIRCGYAYELFTRGVGYLNGSHDLVIAWNREFDFFKKGKNIHKSTRFL